MAAMIAGTVDELLWMVERSRVPALRQLQDFAAEELVIPTGPFAGQRWRPDRQPSAALFFRECASNRWKRRAFTGPSQYGKTYQAFVAPTLYHVFEVGEDVIAGVPDMEMARDKWERDLLPAIERTRYRDLLPRSGRGSRGGTPTSIHFRHGATLRFMSGGGDDKNRAGYTSRVLVITEADGLDEAGANSRESDKIDQLEARTNAFGERAVIYLECTVSIEEGCIWTEYTQGTQSRLALPCPHCREFVTPEREHLLGWQDAADVIAAREAAAFFCPACGETWTEDERRQANLDAKLVHRGQTIDRAGRVHGDPPRTNTLGFRVSGVNNLFRSAADLAEDEFRASRDPDPDNAEKRQRQFTWVLPILSPQQEETPLSATAICDRGSKAELLPRGYVPPDCEYLTVGVDVGKWLLHWLAIAWRPGACGHVVDYGRVECPDPDTLGVERAVLSGLRQLREVIEAGWTMPGEDLRGADQVWVDSQYQKKAVYQFCRESTAGRFFPTMGYGTSQETRLSYSKPKSTGNFVRRIGDGYHFAWQRQDKISLVEIDADQWKSFLHARLATSTTDEKGNSQPGALTLFKAVARDHLSLAKHFTAETQVREWIAGRGEVVRWQRKSRNNHWLDAAYLACGAGHYCGVRILEPARHATPADSGSASPRAKSAGSRYSRDGLAFIASHRT